jgi:beta-carotene 3-hydroxylase
MAAGLSGAAAVTSFAPKNNSLLAAASRRRASPLAFSPLTTRFPARRRGLGTVTCFVLQDTEQPKAPSPVPEVEAALDEEARAVAARRIAERKARKLSERRTYLVAAVMSTLGVTSMAVAAVYYRFSWQMEVLYCNVNVVSLRVSFLLAGNKVAKV